MKLMKELGIELCEYCSLDEAEKGVQSSPRSIFPMSCEESGECEKAYEVYKSYVKEVKQMFTRNMVSDFLRALANEIDDHSVKLDDVQIDNTYKEKQLIVNYEELRYAENNKEELDNE